MSVMGMDVGVDTRTFSESQVKSTVQLQKEQQKYSGSTKSPSAAQTQRRRLSATRTIPVLFPVISSSGLGNYVGVLLQSWNVTRMAIIAQSDDLLGSGYAKDVQTNAPKYGVSYISMINLKGKLTQDMVNYAKIAIQRDDIYLHLRAGRLC
ncbi:hypothetical protein BCR33DRAFT_198789 [Rhizoclosmatium globosum]|uniref:Uncharacterized protein n=1 Tax=Rhizoclosmatium globosum TaxID=329046 RepID=A0A1Y2CE41_9FUNG|nr:hypothetical protein BCR33DRAFT_198789 [Rhizoclosmatium globosum]|eukprot:ORY45330.1 hypothetical protein BCR33DRAFT_198789 [Rhizoclosmatium globosum]